MNTKDDQIKKLRVELDDTSHTLSKLKSQKSSLEQEISDQKQSYDRKIQAIAEQCDKIVADKNQRILKLEDEVKTMHEQICRKTKFENMFSLDQPLESFEIPKPDLSNAVNQSVEIRSVQDLPQHRMTPERMSVQRLPSEMTTPPPMSGTKENPIELKPIGVSPAQSHHSSIQSHHSPKFPGPMNTNMNMTQSVEAPQYHTTQSTHNIQHMNTAHNVHNIQSTQHMNTTAMNNTNTHNAIPAQQVAPPTGIPTSTPTSTSMPMPMPMPMPVNPSSNPFYSGAYHGQNRSMMGYMTAGSQLSTPKSSERNLQTE